MKSRLSITPLSNIENGYIVDVNQVKTDIYDSNMDVFTFKNIRTNELRRSNLMSISMFDDLIIIDEIEYKPVGMLSKNKF